MEGIAGTASVIAIVGFALSSTQAIRKAVSGFRNAPETIQQMSARVVILSNLLKQLEEYSNSLHYATDLPDLIGKCAKNLGEIQEKLEKVSSKKRNRTEKWKKDFIVMLQGREWEKRSAIVQQHYEALSLQINIIMGHVLSFNVLH